MVNVVVVVGVAVVVVVFAVAMVVGVALVGVVVVAAVVLVVVVDAILHLSISQGPHLWSRIYLPFVNPVGHQR